MKKYVDFKCISFKASKYNSLSKHVKQQLTPACFGLLELLQEYAKSTKNDKVILHFLVDSLQETDTHWCGVFILYFLHNLYNPSIDKKSNANEICNVEHIKMVINENFNSSNKKQNDRALNSVAMQAFAKEYNINGNF